MFVVIFLLDLIIGISAWISEFPIYIKILNTILIYIIMTLSMIQLKMSKGMSSEQSKQDLLVAMVASTILQVLCIAGLGLILYWSIYYKVRICEIDSALLMLFSVIGILRNLAIGLVRCISDSNRPK